MSAALAMAPTTPCDPGRISQALARDGFVALDQVTDAADLAFIRAQIDQMIRQKKGDDQEWLHDLGAVGQVSATTQALDISHASRLMPSLLDSKFYQRAFEISRSVLGPGTTFLFDHCISKAPLSQTVTAWHQDDAYSGRISFTGGRMHWWLALQDVDIENSCMQFVPGSHRWRLLPHRLRSPKAFAKETDLPANAKVVPCPLPAGGATIHIGRTMHFTGVNNTNRERIAWIVQFGVKRRIPTILRWR
jgi:hypothetical protein